MSRDDRPAAVARLARLAATVRGTDRRLPFVYLDTYYYLSMRYYYPPERLRRLGPCVLLDEKRLLGGPAVALADGAQLAGLVAVFPLGTVQGPVKTRLIEVTKRG